ncbi:MAG: bifunctional pyr operon transcriptional regulator/uracil phosphoribosyltransferase PyrR [Planctomycetes bacterium]|nr:bifunctional pyr operon transcriptional regulator/uracil phosphoribosyltransferase PyrR [Planctomycetota bacterium]
MSNILNAEQISHILEDLVRKILSDVPNTGDLAIVGIRSRGEILGDRLCKLISQKTGKDTLCGTLDITMYRDDLNDPHGSVQPVVGTTEIDFDVDNKTIILADDVLFTGRSTRAALDALIALGRPKAIKLAVLVDRAGREFPIQADYAGFTTDVAPDQRVQVHFVESDGKDEVEVDAVE